MKRKVKTLRRILTVVQVDRCQRGIVVGFSDGKSWMFSTQFLRDNRKLSAERVLSK